MSAPLGAERVVGSPSPGLESLLCQPLMTLGKLHDLSEPQFLCFDLAMIVEKEMAIHSSVLAWRIPGTGEPGGLPSMGSHRVGHD